MWTLKTLGAFAVIVGCFAIVYPRFLHPMVLRVFGMQTKPMKEGDPHFPPHLRHNKPVQMDRKPPPSPNDPKDIRQHMRPGPHPGMRAAAEMQKQQSQGSGRGMMGIVLPMYAIGICVYLVYTLFKVFNKRGKYTEPYSKRQPQGEREGEGERYTDRLGFPQRMQNTEDRQDYGESEVQRYIRHKKQERDLEDLLVKMDDSRNVSEDEMRALQKRLEETEAQMTRILQAMQGMQSRASTMAHAAQPAPADTDTPPANHSADEKAEAETVGSTAPCPSSSQDSEKTQDSQSRTSSPDTESFEIVKNSACATTEVSPVSEVSAQSSFEQVSPAPDTDHTGDDHTEEEGEEIVLDGEKGEEKGEESSVRHRKTVHVED